MSNSTFNELWCNLLFNIVSIPFVLLLIALVAHQTISVRNYAATEAGEAGNATEFVEERLF